MAVGPQALVDKDHGWKFEIQRHVPWQCQKSDKSWKQHPRFLDLDQDVDQHLVWAQVEEVLQEDQRHTGCQSSPTSSKSCRHLQGLGDLE